MCFDDDHYYDVQCSTHVDMSRLIDAQNFIFLSLLNESKANGMGIILI